MPSPAEQTQHTIDTAIRMGAVALIAYWCFLILGPFLLAVAWAIIIAVAVYPLLGSVERALGGRSKVALALFAALGLALLIVPSVMLSGSVVEAVSAIHAAHEAGTLEVPPPPATVADWPLIGERLSTLR